jgi:hypothetical protein
MCDFEDFPIISRYSLSQAIMDGILVRISTYHGKPVVATSHILGKIHKADLLKIFARFRKWDTCAKSELSEEEQLFTAEFAGRRVWVTEDSEAYTIMYPEDY